MVLLDRVRVMLAALCSRAPAGRRRAFIGFAVALVIPLAVLADTKPDIAGLQSAPVKIEAVPIASFNRAGEPQTHFGKVDFAGGLVLRAPDNANFGGWSGLVLDPDLRSFIAVSDSGVWMTGSLDYSGDKLSGISGARMGPIRASGDKVLKRRRDRDAEAVALVSGSVMAGSVLISFEQNTRIGRFDVSREGLSPPLAYLPIPSGARAMRRNQGFEAMTVMRGGPLKGTVIALSERLYDRQRNHTGWMWTGGEPKEFHLTNIGDFDVTDIASLPDGTLFVLERRFRWLEGVKMRVRRINAADVRPGATLGGDILIEADMQSDIDNMEGLAVTPGKAGETLMTLISDDNFNHFLQRTVLLQFVLKDAETIKARAEN